MLHAEPSPKAAPRHTGANTEQPSAWGHILGPPPTRQILVPPHLDPLLLPQSREEAEGTAVTEGLPLPH